MALIMVMTFFFKTKLSRNKSPVRPLMVRWSFTGDLYNNTAQGVGFLLIIFCKSPPTPVCPDLGGVGHDNDKRIRAGSTARSKIPGTVADCS